MLVYTIPCEPRGCVRAEAGYLRGAEGQDAREARAKEGESLPRLLNWGFVLRAFGLGSRVQGLSLIRA